MLPDHAPKSLGEVVQGGDLGREAEQTLQVKSLFGCPVRRIAGQQQGQPPAGRSGERRCRALWLRCQTLAGYPLGHDPLPAAEHGLAGFPPQLGAITAALRPPPLQQRHIGHQRTPPGPPCLGLTAAHQLAHGIPGQAEFPGNRLDRQALALETDRFVPGGPAALPALVLPALSARHRRWSVIRLLFAGDWAVYSLDRFAERWSMSIQSGANRLAEVFQQVPTIRRLKRLGCAAPGSVGIGGAAIAADHLDLRVLRQPLGNRIGFPVQGNRVKPIKSFLRTAVALWVMFARRSVLLSKNRST